MNSDDNANPGNEMNIDKILAEVKGMKTDDAQSDDGNKQPEAWSLQDIDSLIKSAKMSSGDGESFIGQKDYSIYMQADVEEDAEAEPVSDNIWNEQEKSEANPDAGSELPWRENRESEHTIEIHQRKNPPEEIVIEPVEEPESETETQRKDADFDFFFSGSETESEDMSAPLKAAGYVGGMETDDARERFLNMLILEKTAEQEIINENDPIEKPGVVLERSRFSRTSDLEPMPTVIPAEEALRAAELEEEKTKIKGGQPAANLAAEEKDEVLDGQIVLKGFENGEIQTEKVNERDVEGDLITRRREKAKNFKPIIVSEEEDEKASTAREFENFDGGSAEKTDDFDGAEPLRKKRLEYLFPEQKNRIYYSINTACKRAAVSTAALTVIELICLALIFVPGLLKVPAAGSAAAVENGKAYLFVNLFLLVTASFFSMPCIVSGFKSLFKFKPNCDTAVSISVAFCAVQIILASFLSQTPGGTLSIYSAAAIFALLLNAAGRKISHSCTLDNFKFCAFDSPQNLYMINEIEDENEAFEIGRGILMENPSVVYSSKVVFPADFIKNSRDVGLAEKFSGILVPVVSGVSLLAGVAAWAVTKNFLAGFSMLTCAMCIGVPAGAFLSSSFPLRAANKRLNADGAMIVNQSSAEECAKCNAVVIDSAVLFDRMRCDMHGMKEYKNFRIDDIVLYAAAMVIKSGGPLTDVFDKVIAGHRELLPPVKSISYEDRLGLTAWIHGQKVFLGNRTFLINHNIEVPGKAEEDKYKHDGRRVMYLAMTNKIAAMFVVSYTADEALLPYLKSLENNGIQLLVRTCDSNITEDLLADCFELPINDVKVISATAGRIFKRNRDAVRETAPARVLHNGTSFTLIKSVAVATGLCFSIRFAQLIQIIGVGMGLFGLLVLIFLSLTGIAGSVQIIIFQAFWTFISLATGFLKRVK